MKIISFHHPTKAKNLITRLLKRPGPMPVIIVKPPPLPIYTPPPVVTHVVKTPTLKKRIIDDRANRLFDEELEYIKLQKRMAKKVGEMQRDGLIKEMKTSYKPSPTAPTPGAKAGLMDCIGEIFEATNNTPHTFKRHHDLGQY
ncbi:MAG: hypothetical protein ABJB11_00325 [Ferruginibacter sp.]